jgi:hypothetical protein
MGVGESQAQGVGVERGVNRAGEGAFSPTPHDLAQLLAQIKKIEIDLSELYMLIPHVRASTILSSILQNYRYVNVIALVNISSDTGLEVFKDAFGVAEIFKHEEDDLAAVEKVTKEIIRRLGSLGEDKDIFIITLYDGYETAIAWVARW